MNSNSRPYQTAIRLLPIIFLLNFVLQLFASPSAPQKYWVFFRDKGSAVLAKSSAAMQEAQNRLSPRALARRAKVMPPDRLVTEEDLPIAANYVVVLQQRGFEIIHESRWLNGVSILATEEEAGALAELPFVKEVRRVARLQHPPEPEVEAIEAPPLFKTAAHKLDYGNSLSQNEQLQVPTLHDAGINGSGVLVGMLDSGFRWQDHEAFQHLKNRVIGERDFVNDDDVTRDEPGDPGGHDSHGTQTLSTLGGFKPGQLIGPAFGASFIFAKTEYIPTETHAEEDNWAEAIEWMEALGVEVTSTSLGYSTFDPGQVSYTPADMDGKTAIITKAAELAVSHGVIVVNSAGNEGNNSWRIISAPADGPNVIAVGAVNSSGAVVGFSSRGPTADGRIKPDVMAKGSGVQVVSPSTSNQYTSSSGTSFSCPLAAGVAAQILSAHPELTPAQMMEALRNTASRAGAPDNDYGYGIVNAKAAITYWGPAFSNLPEVVSISPSELQVTVRILSKAGLQSNQTFLHYAVGASTTFTPVSMTQIDSISYAGNLPQIAPADTFKIYFSARELNATSDVTYPKNAPAEFLRVTGNGQIVGGVQETPQAPRTFSLFQNYPNPVQTGTTIIGFHLEKPEPVTVKIFNRLGQEVATLVSSQVFNAGVLHRLIWDGRDASGRRVAAGIYFYQVAAGDRRLARKMVLLP